jgi:hypothetical protein
MPSTTIADLPAGVVSAILAQLTCVQAQCSGQRVCRDWRDACRRLHAEKGFAPRIFVTLAADNKVMILDGDGNTVQTFTPLPPPQKKRTSNQKSSWRNQKHLYKWPTCLALGPRPGSLYVSQYRVRGVLRFDTDATGTTYRYKSVVASGEALESPEGLVCNSDGSLFVVSAAHGTINHVSAGGRVLRTVSCASWTRPGSGFMAGTFRVPWGMSRGPDRALYVAVHSSDGGSYTAPTPRDTGDVLRIELTEDNSFPEHLPTGQVQDMMPRVLSGLEWRLHDLPWTAARSTGGMDLGAVIREQFERERASDPGLGLNRPSNPAFFAAAGAGAGRALLLSTFVRSSDDAEGETDARAGAAGAAQEAVGGAAAAPPAVVNMGDDEVSGRRGIAVFAANEALAARIRGKLTRQQLDPSGLADAANAEAWRPWGLYGHGTKLFATGHGEEADTATGAAPSSEDGGTVDGQAEEGGGAAAGGGAVCGSIRVWSAAEGQWRQLRGGLREPNYLIVN